LGSTSTLLTPGEPSFEEIKELGLRAGAPTRENWQHFWFKLLLSPTYYVRTIAKALRLVFFTGTTAERGFSIALWLVIISGAVATQNLTMLLISYGIPRILFESIELIRALVEHNFLDPASPNNREIYFKKTYNVILAAPLPELSPTISRWMRTLKLAAWGMRMISYIPARMIVLSGDMILHGNHHIKPKASYINYEQERLSLMKKGVPIYSHWGLIAAIEAFFESLEKQPQDLFGPSKI